MIGRRLKLARASAGLSLRDLAEKIDNLVSAQAIGKYERDEMMPGSKALIALANALDVSEGYLLSSGEVELEDVEFRHDANERAEAMVHAHVLSAVERYLEIEELLGEGDTSWDQPKGYPYPVRSIEDVEAAAAWLRSEWVLGSDPIPNLSDFLEEKGIKIITLAFCDKTSGMMGWVRRKDRPNVPIILINNGHDGERQRFTLAHELGHLMLDICKTLNEEKVCNRFAGSFLMPLATIHAVIGRKRHDIAFGELFQIKKLFGASIQAIVYRCKDLGVVNDALFRRIFDKLREHGWKKKEPYNFSPEQPGRFIRLCYKALAENVISESKAAELLNLSVAELNRRMDEAPECNPHANHIGARYVGAH